MQTTQRVSHLNFAKGFRGGERQTLLLIEALSQRGYQQTLVTRRGSELAKRVQKLENVEVIELSKPYFLHLAKMKKSPLLHAHETKAAQVAFWQHLFACTPYIITRRVDISIKQNVFNRNLYEKSFTSVVLSKAIQKSVLQLSPNIKTQVIPSATTSFAYNEENIQTIKAKYANKFVIGNIGALEYAKGQQYLLEVAKAFQKSHPDIHFLFLGTGKDETAFKEMAKGLSNVSFEGFVNNVGDYIQCFDLFAFPSLHEGLGSILLDVIAAKVPIIASNVGGIPDLIQHEKTGLLFQPKESDTLYQHIETLYLCKTLRESLANEAHKTIENFNINTIADAYEKLYAKAIKV